MPSAPVLDTAATSSGVAAGPIGACINGNRHGTFTEPRVLRPFLGGTVPAVGSVSTSSGEPPSAVAGGEASLERLLESLGPHVLQVVADPHGLAVPVGDPVIYDPTERAAIAAGAIVLAVGVRPATA